MPTDPNNLKGGQRVRVELTVIEGWQNQASTVKCVSHSGTPYWYKHADIITDWPPEPSADEAGWKDGCWQSRSNKRLFQTNPLRLASHAPSRPAGRRRHRGRRLDGSELGPVNVFKDDAPEYWEIIFMSEEWDIYGHYDGDTWFDITHARKAVK